MVESVEFYSAIKLSNPILLHGTTVTYLSVGVDSLFLAT